LVGVENTTSAKKSQYYNQIKNIQDIISTLEDRYEDAQDRYWSKYTTLETYISKMNSQSSVFSS
jgi:flagellar hook-associated protein 2